MTKLIAVDSETHLIRPGMLAPKMVCVAFDDGESSDVVVGEKALQLVRYTLGGSDTTAYCNAPYDLGVFCAEDPKLIPVVFKALDEGRVIDVAILEALHDNALGMLFQHSDGRKFNRYSLQLLTERHLGEDISESKHGPDAWRLRYGELDGKPVETWPAAARAYPLQDVDHTRRAANIQLAPDRFNIDCHTHEMQAAWALHLMSLHGMRTDPVTVEQATKAIEELHVESREKFLKLGFVKLRKVKKVKGVLEEADTTVDGQGYRYQANSKVLMARVEAAYDGKPPMTKGGKTGKNKKTSTERQTLLDSGDEDLAEYAEAGVNEKLYSTYVDVLRQGTQVPINPEVNIIVATGRASIRKPALQTMPRKGPVRESFIARPDKVLCSVDYGGGELATWAQICLWLFKQSNMAKRLLAGINVHTHLASRLGNRPYEEMLKLVKAKDEFAEGLRTVAKNVGFGLPGGMGPPTLVKTAHKAQVRFCVLSRHATTCGTKKVREYWTGAGKRRKAREIPPTCAMCLELATEYRRIWYEEYPEAHDYFAYVKQVVDSGKPAVSFGNGMLRGGLDFSACANHYFQNLLAYAAKRAAYKLAKECYLYEDSVLFGSRPELFVHDEILTEMDETAAPAAADKMAAVMREAFTEVCPDVPIKADPALMKRWYKNADTVRDASGKLLVWEPEQQALAVG